MVYRYFWLFLFPIIIFGNTGKPFVFDRNFSPVVSSNDTHLILQELSDLKTKYVPIENISSSFAKGLIRLFELALVWDPINYITSMVQHEVFGHGYRIRSLPYGYAEVTNYHFSIKWPDTVSHSGASTGFTISKDIGAGPLMAIGIGGIEGSSIMAKQLKMTWLQNRKINPLQANLYLYSFHDLTFYVMGTPDDNMRMENDITGYLYLLNEQYHSSLTVSELRQQVAANFLDPMTYFAIYSYYRYIITGKDTRIPMISMGDIRYLPAFRCSLAPYGIEYYFENFFLLPQTLYTYVRYGSFASSKYYGLGAEMPNIWTLDQLQIGGRFDLYHQPNIPFKKGYIPVEDEYIPYNQNRDLWGCLFTVMANYSSKDHVSAYGEIGYKTRGYIPGESLQNQIIIRTGLGLKW